MKLKKNIILRHWNSSSAYRFSLIQKIYPDQHKTEKIAKPIKNNFW